MKQIIVCTNYIFIDVVGNDTTSGVYNNNATCVLNSVNRSNIVVM